MIDRGKGEGIMGCEACKIRRYAERKPESWIARLWRWHTGWCPGWKRYQAELTRQKAEQEKATA
jgi:hypothetical protein